MEEETEPQTSSFLATALNVAKSGFSVLAAIDIEKRLQTCRNCANGQLKANTVTCALCNCNMNIKARFEATKCPINTAW